MTPLKERALSKANLDGMDLEAHLFFQARNLAIESMLLRLENKLLRQDFPADCTWNESSFGPPTVLIRMRNPKPAQSKWEYGTCRLALKRDIIKAPENLSKCYYSIANFAASEYWGGREPAKLIEFRKVVQALYDDGTLAQEVAKVNFPFDYNSFSSFG